MAKSCSKPPAEPPPTLLNETCEGDERYLSRKYLLTFFSSEPLPNYEDAGFQCQDHEITRLQPNAGRDDLLGPSNARWV